MTEFVVALLGFGVLFGFFPGFALRLLVLLYPADDPRRRELIAELYVLKRMERVEWVFQQLETALFEGIAARMAQRRDGRAEAPPEDESSVPRMSPEKERTLRDAARVRAMMWVASAVESWQFAVQEAAARAAQREFDHERGVNAAPDIAEVLARIRCDEVPELIRRGGSGPERCTRQDQPR